VAYLTVELRAWPRDTWAKVGIDPQAAAGAVVAGWQRGDLLGLRLGGLAAEETLAVERPAMTYVRGQLGDRLWWIWPALGHHPRWDLRCPPSVPPPDSGIVGASGPRAWKARPWGRAAPAPTPNGQVRTDLNEPSLTAGACSYPLARARRGHGR
jgi:hypothetical protein